MADARDSTTDESYSQIEKCTIENWLDSEPERERHVSVASGMLFVCYLLLVVCYLYVICC